jgi:hypothetical protein
MPSPRRVPGAPNRPHVLIGAAMPTVSPPLSAARAQRRGKVVIRFLTADSFEHPLSPRRFRFALPLPSPCSRRWGAATQATGESTSLFASTYSSLSCHPPPVIDEVPSHPHLFQPPPRAPRCRIAPAILQAGCRFREVYAGSVFLYIPSDSASYHFFDLPLASTSAQSSSLGSTSSGEFFSVPSPQIGAPSRQCPPRAFPHHPRR